MEKVRYMISDAANIVHVESNHMCYVTGKMNWN